MNISQSHSELPTSLEPSGKRRIMYLEDKWHVKIWKEIEEWIKKMWFTHTYTQWNITQLWKWNHAICSNIDGSRDYHTKWSKSKTNITRCCLYVESKKNGTNEPILKRRNRVTDVENKFMVTRGLGGRDNLGLWDWHIHTTIHKTDNKDLHIAQGTLLSAL